MTSGESVKAIVGADTAPYALDDDNCEFLKVEMGHGLSEPCDQRPLDDVSKVVLEKLFQQGVEKSSQRKGILELAEVFWKQLPSLLCPDKLAIGRWLSGRLKKKSAATNNNDEEESYNTNTPTTEFMRRQKNVSVIKNDVKALCKVKGPVAQQTFEKLYNGIVLEVLIDDDDDDSEMDVRIVTSEFFHKGGMDREMGWYVRTDIACEAEACKASAQKYFLAELNDILDIKIARGTSRRM
jgi:hypothetical protein